MNNKQLSNCCKAEVKVSTGEEGTSCWICSSCLRPCDLFSEKEKSKEQTITEKLGLQGKITQKHSEEIEEIIQKEIKQKLQDQQKLNNSGRKMYQHGQRDERERIIGVIKTFRSKEIKDYDTLDVVFIDFQNDVIGVIINKIKES